MLLTNAQTLGVKYKFDARNRPNLRGYMKKNLIIMFCLLFYGCTQNEPPTAAKKELKKESTSFLASLELKDLPSIEDMQAIVVTPIKPTKKVKNKAEVITTGPARALSISEKALFKQIFSKENFNFKIKKKCIFIAEFMVAFDKHEDFILFVSLSTNQVQILNKNEYQIIDFSTAFESSENLKHLRALLTAETNTQI